MLLTLLKRGCVLLLNERMLFFFFFFSVSILFFFFIYIFFLGFRSFWKKLIPLFWCLLVTISMQWSLHETLKEQSPCDFPVLEHIKMFTEQYIQVCRTSCSIHVTHLFILSTCLQNILLNSFSFSFVSQPWTLIEPRQGFVGALIYSW